MPTKQDVINAGGILIAAGAAITIFALRDTLFPPPPGTTSLKLSNLNLECFAFIPEGISWNINCLGSVLIKNTGTVDIQPFLKIEVISRSPSGDIDHSPVIFHDVDNPIRVGETFQANFTLADHRVDSPAVIDYIITVSNSEGFEFSQITRTLVLSEQGNISNK